MRITAGLLSMLLLTCLSASAAPVKADQKPAAKVATSKTKCAKTCKKMLHKRASASAQKATR